MNANSSNGLLAIDVGSSRVKLGWFPPAGECVSEPKATTLPIAAPALPQPEATLAVSHQDAAKLRSEITDWQESHAITTPNCVVASVHPAALDAVQQVFTAPLRVLTATDLAVEVQVDQPERVGIDRLLNAVSVNRLRLAGRPAMVVDLGTACTVDWITPEGTFAGGAIFPGTNLSASALHVGTASLPNLSFDDSNETPAVIGKSTQAAISSGLYWGMVGAVRELVTRMSENQTPTPQLFITGGGAPRLVAHLTSDNLTPRHIPSLVLSGIALTAQGLL